MKDGAEAGAGSPAAAKPATKPKSADGSLRIGGLGLAKEE
jgi:hypothetical protein